MEIEVKIPSVGESVKEATIAQWFKRDGEAVQKDEPLFAIETDKVTLEVVSPAGGMLRIKLQEGETAAIGTLAAVVDSDKAQGRPEPEEEKNEPEKAGTPAASETPVIADKRMPEEKESPVLSPAVRNLVAQHKLNAADIEGSGRNGRITKADVLTHLEKNETQQASASTEQTEEKKTCLEETDEDLVERKPMSSIRKRIAQHLVAAKQNTAMLTTFNEIDMSGIMAARAHYKDAFKTKYDVSLGFMSFFIKACTTALMEFPQINAFIDGDDIIYHHYVHMGIAIGGKRGLVVPVIRHAEKRSYAELEQSIVDFVDKIDRNQLALSDLEDGTFTISNGGVYGSLLSTPILNMPQSGILGMHKIEKRPVVVDDEIVVRPMMYIALSYDHRIVDGREAVTFLKRIKESIEDPQRIMLEI
jgi:2-oxoglutarate dehydrogenase E2 component (dihydrolipoamide succinyltransferase)